MAFQSKFFITARVCGKWLIKDTTELLSVTPSPVLNFEFAILAWYLLKLFVSVIAGDACCYKELLFSIEFVLKPKLMVGIISSDVDILLM